MKLCSVKYTFLVEIYSIKIDLSLTIELFKEITELILKLIYSGVQLKRDATK